MSKDRIIEILQQAMDNLIVEWDDDQDACAEIVEAEAIIKQALRHTL